MHKANTRPWIRAMHTRIRAEEKRRMLCRDEWVTRDIDSRRGKYVQAMPEVKNNWTNDNHLTVEPSTLMAR